LSSAALTTLQLLSWMRQARKRFESLNKRSVR
jgi:hypothetical protein